MHFITVIHTNGYDNSVTVSNCDILMSNLTSSVLIISCRHPAFPLVHFRLSCGSPVNRKYTPALLASCQSDNHFTVGVFGKSLRSKRIVEMFTVWPEMVYDSVLNIWSNNNTNLSNSKRNNRISNWLTSKTLVKVVLTIMCVLPTK